MFKLIAVTNRKLCHRPLAEQVNRICRSSCKPAGIILREKDLPEADYARLAQELLPICREQGVQLVLHNFWRTALDLVVRDVHLPLHVLASEAFQKQRSFFRRVGASVHSAAELQQALAQGADYVSAGHIFTTQCKEGVPPRGLDFLQELCSLSSVPVYAIGGIALDEEQWRSLQQRGAQGACIMSAYMRLD